jgi:predicted NAD/FAD-binding protein
MKIAIIGTGISGLVCARLLHGVHDVTLFEAADYVGGHTHTVPVDANGESHQIDTGFIVFNHQTYPHFTRLLEELAVASEPTSMSFSVRDDRIDLEYNGSDLNGLLAQRRNLIRPRFHRMLWDILRFHRESPELLHALAEEVTVGEFLRDRRYSRAFAEHYLLPMGAAIWSCPLQTFERFPMRFILQFYRNHGLMQLRDRPVWRVISGGSQRYVERLTAPFRDRVHVNCPVQTVTRGPESVTLTTPGRAWSFDEVIFACHSDQALALLTDPMPLERELLSEFPYSANSAVLHTDISVLPRRRRAWASWNYHVRAGSQARPTVTYNMTMLQHIRSPRTFCVTLNEEDAIRPEHVLGRWEYAHPIFTVRREAAQRRHHEVIRHQRTSYCGAYWGNGFHEDGVNSARAVCRRFGIVWPAAAAASEVVETCRTDSRTGGLVRA